MKCTLFCLLACALLAGGLAGCGQTGDSAPSSVSQSVQQEISEPTPYPADILTGLPRKAAQPDDQRIVGVMVNNYTACRPQRGLSQAQVLCEIKVEGGISRFMALYSDCAAVPEVGPLPSGRDQFFRLVLPWQPLYVHIGQSTVQSQYIRNYSYDEWNIEGRHDAFWWHDTQRRNLAGEPVDTQHTAYTDGEHLADYMVRKQVDTHRIYHSPLFEFMDAGLPRRIPAGPSAHQVTVQHSPYYRTRFVYDWENKQYKMSQYYPPEDAYRDTLDENNGQQLVFDNLIVLFADIHTYPDYQESDLQYVEYAQEGTGYYCYRGRSQPICWDKGSDLEALSLYDTHRRNRLKVNCGTSYVAVVDVDEAGRFACESRIVDTVTPGPLLPPELAENNDED